MVARARGRHKRNHAAGRTGKRADDSSTGDDPRPADTLYLAHGGQVSVSTTRDKLSSPLGARNLEVEDFRHDIHR